MNVTCLAPSEGAYAEISRVYARICRLVGVGDSRRTGRSGGKRLSDAPISGGRGFAMAARFAATALLALGTLTAVATLSASDAHAQQPECAVPTDASCSITITPTTANLVNDGSNSAEFTVNITGYEFGSGNRGGTAGRFLGVIMNLNGSAVVPNPTGHFGVGTCDTAALATCRREFNTDDLTVSLPDSVGDDDPFFSFATGAGNFGLALPAALLTGGTDVFTIRVSAGPSVANVGDKTFSLDSARAYANIVDGAFINNVSSSFIALPTTKTEAGTATFTIVVQPPTLDDLRVELTTGNGSNPLDLISYMSDTFTYEAMLDETQIAARTGAALRYVAQGNSGNYTIICKGRRVITTGTGFQVPADRPLPARPGAFVLNVYVVTAANVAADNAPTNFAATPPVVQARGGDNPAACADALRASEETYVTRYAVTISRTADRALSGNRNLADISAAIAGTDQALLLTTTTLAPDSFVPGTGAYEVLLPYNGGADHDNVTLTAALVTAPPASANNGAPVRFCTTETAAGMLTSTPLGEGLMSDVAGGHGATSGEERVVRLDGIGTTDVIPVTIYVTAEDDASPPTDCATAADNAETTATLVTISVAPAPTGSGVIGTASPPSVAAGGFSAMFDVTLSDIPGRVYNGNRLVNLTHVDVTLGTFTTDGGGDASINTFTDDAASIATNDFTLTAPQGVTFQNDATNPGTVIVLRVPRSSITFTSGVDTTLTFTVATAAAAAADGTPPQDISIDPAASAIIYGIASGTPAPTGSATNPALTNPDADNDIFTISVNSPAPTLTGLVATHSFQQNVALDTSGVALFASHNSAESLTYTVAPNTAPPGLTFNLGVSPPTITGTPTSLGTTSYTLTARDTTNDVTTGDFSITVNEAPPTTVTVSPEDPSISEDGGSVGVVITLNNVVRAQDVTAGPPPGTVDVPFTIMGDATDGTDYTITFPTTGCTACTATAGTLNFAIGENEKTIIFAAVDNTAEATNKTIEFDLTMGMIALQSDTADPTDGNAKNMLEVEADDDTDITINNDDMAPVSVTVSPPTASIREEGGEVDIIVTLNSAAVDGAVISLPFTFEDHATLSPAVFATDYTVTFPTGCTLCDLNGGTLTFAAGQQTTTITIEGRDDSIIEVEDEGDEVVIFQLGNGNHGGVMVDATADASRSEITLREITVEVEEIMAEVETVSTVIGATQVSLTTGLIQARFSGVAGAPSAGGAPLALTGLAGGATTALHLPDNPQDLGDMLGGLGVEHTAKADGGGAYAVWARGQYSSMEGDPTVGGNKITYDGDSTGLGFGAEWTTAGSITGVAVNWLTTDLDLSSTSMSTTLSNYEESLLMVAPYLAIRRANGRSFWVSAGFGTGEADATLEAGVGTASADVSTSFLNAGADFTLRENAASQLIGGLSALAIRKTVDSFKFTAAGIDPIPRMTINTFRMRGDVTYHHPVEIGGKLVRPYVGVATLHDAGDRLNDDSHAVDLRGGANFQDAALDLNLEFSTELLREDHQSWTISGSGRYQFAPDGFGASLSLDGTHAAESAMGIEGGYGMAMSRVHRAALLTPFAGMRHGSEGGELSSGMRFAIGGEMDADVKAVRRLRDAEDTLKLSFRQSF